MSYDPADKQCDSAGPLPMMQINECTEFDVALPAPRQEGLGAFVTCMITVGITLFKYSGIEREQIHNPFVDRTIFLFFVIGFLIQFPIIHHLA